MKNEKVVTSWNRLNPTEEGRNRMIYKVEEKQKRRRPVFRPKLGAAMAAVLYLAIIGVFTLTPQNAFAVKAYELEEQEGAIGLRDVDLVDQPDVWGGYYDNENFYVSVGLKYEGKNIKNVEFTTAEGFFAKQYIGNLKMKDGVSRMYVGAENRLVMVGKDFEIAGGSITLDDETMTDDLLLFWGITIPDASDKPEQINIVAKATFNNGKTEEKAITIDISGTGAYSVAVDPEERDRHFSEAVKSLEYYRNLPLEQCELVPESVKAVTDVYEYGTNENRARFEIRDGMEFDENGIYRGGMIAGGLGEKYVMVIERSPDGELTGMLYRLPAELEYSGE